MARMQQKSRTIGRYFPFRQDGAPPRLWNLQVLLKPRYTEPMLLFDEVDVPSLHNPDVTVLKENYVILSDLQALSAHFSRKDSPYRSPTNAWSARTRIGVREENKGSDGTGPVEELVDFNFFITGAANMVYTMAWPEVELLLQVMQLEKEKRGCSYDLPAREDTTITKVVLTASPDAKERSSPTSEGEASSKKEATIVS